MLHRRAIVAFAVALSGVLLVASAAGAHVTVQPGSAAKGSFSIFSFSVPNEEADANTVKLEVSFPVKNPIPFVSVKPMPGWTISTEKAKLDKPVKTDDGEITEAVDLFTVSAGPLPTNVKQLAFPTLQTYSSGEVVRWIQATAKGAPEPDFPVPTLTLTKASSGHH